MPSETVQLSGDRKAVVAEITVKTGLILLEEAEKDNGDLTPIIYYRPLRLMELVGSDIEVTESDGAALVDMELMTHSDLDVIGQAFVKVNASFLSRTRLGRKAKMPEPEITTEAIPKGD
jgi:hypothetical protein